MRPVPNHQQMKHTLLILFILFTISLTAQNSFLNGYWKGHITQSTLEGQMEDVVFELYLRVNGSKVSGRSYAYQTNGDINEMEVRGMLHSDRSVTLYDHSHVALENSGVTPNHKKKYQFAHYRSAFLTANKLSGYWQEIVNLPFSTKRRRGRVELRKVNNEVNKP